MSCLNNEPFEPLGSRDLDWLTLKTVSDSFLASGKRRSKVHTWVFSRFNTMTSGIMSLILILIISFSKPVLEGLVFNFLLDSFTIYCFSSLSVTQLSGEDPCSARTLEFLLE